LQKDYFSSNSKKFIYANAYFLRNLAKKGLKKSLIGFSLDCHLVISQLGLFQLGYKKGNIRRKINTSGLIGSP